MPQQVVNEPPSPTGHIGTMPPRTSILDRSITFNEGRRS
jgi:hypothetical protein